MACTMGMLQCLDRPHRLVYVLGEILEMPGPEASHVLGIEPALGVSPAGTAVWHQTPRRARATARCRRHCAPARPGRRQAASGKQLAISQLLRLQVHRTGNPRPPSVISRTASQLPLTRSSILLPNSDRHFHPEVLPVVQRQDRRDFRNAEQTTGRPGGLIPAPRRRFAPGFFPRKRPSMARFGSNPTTGADTNFGSKASPLRTVAEAARRVNQRSPVPAPGRASNTRTWMPPSSKCRGPKSRPSPSPLSAIRRSGTICTRLQGLKRRRSAPGCF